MNVLSHQGNAKLCSESLTSVSMAIVKKTNKQQQHAGEGEENPLVEWTAVLSPVIGTESPPNPASKAAMRSCHPGLTMYLHNGAVLTHKREESAPHERNWKDPEIITLSAISRFRKWYVLSWVESCYL